MKFIKKHIKLIILLLVIISIFIIFNLTNKNNINYTSIGDGFALGKNSYGEINYGYSDYIRDYLKEEDKLNFYTKSFSKENISISKLTADIITNKKIKIKNEEINIKQTLRETSILTMSIGINDLIYRVNIEDNLTDEKINNIVNDVYKEFNELIKEIRKYYPHKIYVIGYYTENINNYYLKLAINKLNKKQQTNEEIIYIDTKNIFENNKSLLSNPKSIYPNRTGYKEISNEIIAKITKKLEKV